MTDTRVQKVLMVLLLAGLVLVLPAAAASTEVTVIKYANDGTTVLDQRTLSIPDMETNLGLPVYGDGTTHYYFQGPTFDPANMWDPAEEVNVMSRDYGAVKGTDVRDLCNLVGGMNAGEYVTIKATDNFAKSFDYDDVYSNPDYFRMVLAWYVGEDGTGEAQGTGYPPDFYSGMRLFFFANTSTNPWGYHVFGNWDMHENLAADRWHYYYDGTFWPSSSGLSVKYVNRILIYSDDPAPPTMDVLFDGTVTLVQDAPFTQLSKEMTSYTIQEDTPLGALHATGLTYGVTDKRWTYDSVLLLDDVGTYMYNSPGKWFAYVNEVYKDGYGNTPDGLNVIQLNDNDEVKFYYVSGYSGGAHPTYTQAIVEATAAVKTVADVVAPDYPVAKFSASPLTGLAPLTVNFQDESTGLAHLSYEWDFQNDGTVDSTEQNPSFTYDMVAKYTVKLTVTNTLGSDDEVKTDYIDAITMPTDWSLELSGAVDTTVDKAYFEEGLTCPSSGHQVFWTDGDGNEWGGVPLWFLVGMVDDDPDVGPLHFNFNDDIAAEHYEVNVIGSDGTSITLDSAAIARNDNYIVANTLNDAPLPPTTPAGKPSWPLHLKGSGVLTGQQIGGIARIELSGLPEPPEAWTLQMLGEVGDTIPKSEYEAGLACPMSDHYIEWTDGSGTKWSGVPLWVLLGSVDDIELADHWTFSDTVADAGYTVKMVAADGYSRTFTSAQVKRNDGYIVANKKNGVELTAADGYPLKLNGPAITSGKDRVGTIVRIEILELQTPPAEPGSYNLAVKGKITDVLSQVEIEEGLGCPASGHYVEWTQVIKNDDGSIKETHVWSGIPLWFLAGWVDDRQPHEFNAVQAMAGYKVTVKASDGFAKTFASTDVAWSNRYIIATMMDGAPLTTSGPLRLVGDAVTKPNGALGGGSVGKIAEIELTEFGVPVQIPKLHIVKYGDDRTTVVDEVLIDYTAMIAQFDTIGDGTNQYKFQGVTMDPTDIWGQYDQTKGGFKISNAVKGTRLYDLVSLVGGMGAGTDLVLVASDGYKTILPYTSVYTTPAIQALQGDAILAWYADGKYVPSYADGMRLFFMPDDHIYAQWDMHETMPPGYWHYYYQSYDPSDPDYGQYAPGILYPSAAGLSAKYVTEIRVYTKPETQWDLQLDGTRVGGIAYTVAKTYFEQALACQFGANHGVSYTDSKGTWNGMPLWFLAGFVDDADMHSNTAYNEELALAGYDIVVKARDGYTKVFDSVPTVRSNDYIVTSTLNGATFPETDKNWPLKLKGVGVPTGGLQVGGINTIILNLRPVIDSLTISTDPVKVGTDATAVAYFTDPYDTHTAVFDWGDGTTSAGVVDETAHSITGSHAYTMPGFYIVKVTLKDSMGVEATATSSTQFIVYDPQSGFVAGAGSIKSPAGALAADPIATGPATLEFLARYPVLKKEPFKGVTAFQFPKGKIAFTSMSYDWLVIQKEAKKAFYQGSGKIKGEKTYGFLVSVIDGGSKPQQDLFRIRIWDKATGAVVYDTQPGAADTADPTTPLTLGGIAIEKLKK